MPAELAEVANGAMRPILAAVRKTTIDSLPDRLRLICQAGCINEGGRVYLRHLRKRRNASQPNDAWASERWVNQVPLDAETAPGWQENLLRQALAFIDCVMPKAREVADWPLQFTVSLNEDPDPDGEPVLAAASIFLTAVRGPEDDCTSLIEDYRQPVLIVTSPPRRQPE